MELFSIIQKINKKYWFFIKNNILDRNALKKIKIKRYKNISFLNFLIKSKRPIFTNKFKYLIKKKPFSYKNLIQSKNKYSLFFNKKILKYGKKV
jgi:hypothetical protein